MPVAPSAPEHGVSRTIPGPAEGNREVLSRGALVIALLVAAGMPIIACGAYRLIQYDTICIYATAALGLALSFGLAGQLVLAQPAIMGLAAYTCSLAGVHLHLQSYATLWPSLVVAVTANLLISAPGLRIRGWYLAVISFFAVAVFPSLIERTVPGLTGGDDSGLVGIGPLIGGSYTWQPVLPLRVAARPAALRHRGDVLARSTDRTSASSLRHQGWSRHARTPPAG